MQVGFRASPYLVEVSPVYHFHTRTPPPPPAPLLLNPLQLSLPPGSSLDGDGTDVSAHDGEFSVISVGTTLVYPVA